MAHKLALEDLFDAVKTDHKERAKEVLERAKMEVKNLSRSKQRSSKEQNAIDDLDEFIRDVTEGQFRSAKNKCERTQNKFSGHLKGLLESILKNNAAMEQSVQRPTEPPPDYDQEPEPRQLANRVNKESNRSSDMSEHMRKKDVHSQEIPTRSSDELTKDSKRASQLMRHNNPDIADLSDVNRPTKVAERFSELYDNEWTEAFDVLSNKKREDEKKIASLLLTIVEEAYQFCRQEADQEIQEMHSAILDILDFGKVKGNKHSKPIDVTLLVQYRKTYGSRAISRLQKGFFDTKLKSICKTNVGGNQPSSSGVMATYGNRAVELTWWMCVQDPPVYMCPTTREGFSPELYRPYTKSGKHVDFFVWPALRLYENGGILSKGVVQYK